MSSRPLPRPSRLSADELRELALRRVGLKRDPGPGPPHPELVDSSQIPMRQSGALRLLSLNVGHGRRTATHQALLLARTARQNVSEVGRILRQVGPDVIALQEADGPSAWSGNFDHVASLSHHSQLEHFYRGDHNPFGNERFPLASGTALLTAWPMTSIASHRFRLNWRDTKGFVVATVCIPEWRDLEIDVVSVHLDFLRPTIRRQQILRMVDELLPRRQLRPLVVLGDLNCCWQREPNSLRLLGDTLGVRPHEPERSVPTFPAHRPRRRLDWILISKDLEWNAHHTLRTPLSDHLGVVADISLSGARHGAIPRDRRSSRPQGGGREEMLGSTIGTMEQRAEEDIEMRPIVARDVMSREVLTVRDDWPLAKLAAFLADNEITGAPVEDGDGFVAGVVSVVDFVRDMSWPSGGSYLHVPDQMVDGLQEVRLVDEELSVRDLMTPEVVSVEPESTISEVAFTMLRHHLHRVLVVENGQLVGLISTSDLLGLLIDED